MVTYTDDRCFWLASMPAFAGTTLRGASPRRVVPQGRNACRSALMFSAPARAHLPGLAQKKPAAFAAGSNAGCKPELTSADLRKRGSRAA